MTNDSVNFNFTLLLFNLRWSRNRAQDLCRAHWDIISCLKIYILYHFLETLHLWKHWGRGETKLTVSRRAVIIISILSWLTDLSSINLHIECLVLAKWRTNVNVYLPRENVTWYFLGSCKYQDCKCVRLWALTGNDQPNGNSEFCFPETLRLWKHWGRGETKVLWKLAVSRGGSHYSKCFVITSNSKLEKTSKPNRLLFAGWLINLPRFQEARPDHMRVESSCYCFPRELASFARPRE